MDHAAPEEPAEPSDLRPCPLLERSRFSWRKRRTKRVRNITRSSLELLGRAEVLRACSHATASGADILSVFHKFGVIGHARLQRAFFHQGAEVFFVSRMRHCFGHRLLLQRSTRRFNTDRKRLTALWLRVAEDASRSCQKGGSGDRDNLCVMICPTFYAEIPLENGPGGDVLRELETLLKPSHHGVSSIAG